MPYGLASFRTSKPSLSTSTFLFQVRKHSSNPGRRLYLEVEPLDRLAGLDLVASLDLVVLGNLGVLDVD